MNQARRLWLTFLPIPLLGILIALLDRFIDRALFYDPPWLILTGNTLFITVILLAVAVIAVRNFRSTGSVQVLLLGCGVLTFGIGAAVAAAARGLPDGANLNVTIYNTAALIGGVFHFAAAFLLAAGTSAQAGGRHRGPLVALAYGCSLALVAMLSLAALSEWLPRFQFQGVVGFTEIRQQVLASAGALFGFSFVVFIAMYLRSRQAFLYWYSSALGLTALSLAAFFVQGSVGSPVGWAGRCAQYLGGVYFLVSIAVASRSARARQSSLDEVLRASLAGSEEKFRALAENIPDAIRRFDRQMRHLYANPAGVRLYGRTAAGVIGRSIDEVGLPRAQVEQWNRRLDGVFRTGERAGTEEEYCTDRGTRFYESSCVPEFGPDGSVMNVLVVSHDLTERTEAERRLRELSQRLQAVLDAAPAIIWTAQDRACASVTGNRAALLFSRVPAETDMSKTGPRPDLLSHYRIFQNGTELKPDEMPLQRVAATGVPAQNCEVEFRFDSGERRFLLGNVEPLVDDDGLPSGAIGAFLDITTHKAMETRLKEEYRRQEALSRIVTALLSERDPQNALESLAHQVMEVLDCQVFFNFLIAPGADRLHLNACAGIPPEEAARIEWLELAGSVCGSVATEGHRIVVEDIPRSSDRRVALVRSYGILAYACHPLLSAGGRVIGTLSFGTRARDHFSPEDLAYMKTVTDHIAIALERKRSAEELLRMNETLEQRVVERTEEANRLADQLRALASELSQAEQRERKRLSTILHDHIQQLLVAARLQLDGMRPGRDAGQVRSSLQTTRQLLSEALEASRNLTIEISPPILKQLGLIAALQWFANRMKEANRFTVELQVDERAEPDREEVRFLLFECVRELLFNSFKHSGVRQATLSVSRSADAQTVIVVQDQGRGFEPRTPDGKDGSVTAFGLFSIEQRLAYVGGRLQIDSTPGRGARVTIIVPPSTPPRREFSDPAAAIAPWGSPDDPSRAASPEAASDAPAVRTAGGRIRVLMVDDNKNMRDGLSELLELESDIEVVGGAATGSQAIEMAERLRPDVIAMDLNLGGMDGREITRSILLRIPSVKVIGLSMYLEEDVAQSMRDAGAVAYVPKSGGAQDLVDAIRACRRT